MEFQPCQNLPLESPDLTETQIESDEPSLAGIEILQREPFRFETHFQGYMDMYGDVEKVAEYLDAHEGWFHHCARPMKVEPLGQNGYTMTIGQFSALGYEVVPKISVILQPPKDRLYLMHTIPVPDGNPKSYEVDYQAWMKLQELPVKSLLLENGKKLGAKKLPETICRIEWELHMNVAVKFPKFVYRFPLSVIQVTGDRLLSQIVSQVSPGLTYKVQKEFHTRLNLPLPPKNSRNCQKISSCSDRSLDRVCLQ